MPIQVTCPSCHGMFNAPDSAAGKKAKCPKCGGIIQISEAAPEPEIVEAEDAFSGFSDEDFETAPAEPADRDRKPCSLCGELIQRDAIKCRFCGEIFDPMLKQQQLKSSKAAAGDADLSPLEWVVAILCSGIGCIVGIVYIIQGKPKGTKMLIVTICVQAVGMLIALMIFLAIAASAHPM